MSVQLHPAGADKNEHMTHEDMFMENSFRDMVNHDQDMYDKIESVPSSDDNTVNSIIAVVHNPLAEVWSPPRVTALAPEYGLLL